MMISNTYNANGMAISNGNDLYHVEICPPYCGESASESVAADIQGGNSLTNPLPKGGGIQVWCHDHMESIYTCNCGVMIDPNCGIDLSILNKLPSRENHLVYHVICPPYCIKQQGDLNDIISAISKYISLFHQSQQKSPSSPEQHGGPETPQPTPKNPQPSPAPEPPQPTPTFPEPPQPDPEPPQPSGGHGGHGGHGGSGGGGGCSPGKECRPTSQN